MTASQPDPVAILRAGADTHGVPGFVTALLAVAIGAVGAAVIATITAVPLAVDGPRAGSTPADGTQA